MAHQSDISHYSSMGLDGIISMLDVDTDSIEVYNEQNIYAIGKAPEVEFNDEDVSDRFEELASGRALNSRLAWADTLRNVRVFKMIEEQEPNAMLDIGCGMSHPLGRFINQNGLDTHYIGLDPVDSRARLVADEEKSTPRSFVGIWHDARQGLPLQSSTVDFVACLAAVAQFCLNTFELEEFFSEVNRVMLQGCTFVLSTPNKGGALSPLQHPHCHENEFTAHEVINAFERTGFHVNDYYNYRVRPGVVNGIRKRKAAYNDDMYPTALADAFELPRLTRRDVVPGNVFYQVTKL
jgi:ubiquinone/menaquinone biosynthesis C-methylase UbiE